jgi:L-lactate dehydrogenase
MRGDTTTHADQNFHSPGETKVQLVEHNSAVLRSIIEAMKPLRKDAILLIVSNPVDVLTTVAQETSGLARSQVIGSGTSLDSVRMRRLLANRLDVRTVFAFSPSHFGAVAGRCVAC